MRATPQSGLYSWLTRIVNFEFFADESSEMESSDSDSETSTSTSSSARTSASASNRGSVSGHGLVRQISADRAPGTQAAPLLAHDHSEDEDVDVQVPAEQSSVAPPQPVPETPRGHHPSSSDQLKGQHENMVVEEKTEPKKVRFNL